jgi:hypothetical protein
MAANFSGVLNANLEKSRFLGSVPQAFSVKIAQWDSELKAWIAVTRSVGSEDQAAILLQSGGRSGQVPSE